MSSQVNGIFAEQMTPEDGCLSVIDSFDDDVEVKLPSPAAVSTASTKS